MGLKKKVIFSVNAAIVLVCICMGVVAYINANSGFNKALEMKASSDVQALSEIIDYRYAGDWNLRDGVLYKGDTKIDGNDELVDSLAKVTNGKVTIFSGDTRVATNVKDAAGKRQVGTKASEAVINEVLKGGKNFLGTANVVGEEHHAAYLPLKDNSGNVIGMLFVGVSVHEMDDVVSSLITTIIIIMLIIIVGGVVASSVIVGRMLGALDEVVQATGKIADGDLRFNDLTIHSDDEFGTLAKEINDMKNKLKNILTRIATSSERVAESAEELTAATSQGADSIHEMAQSASDMNEESDAQMKTIEVLQEKLQNMRKRMDDLYRMTMAMDAVAMSSAKSTVLGQEKMATANKVMDHISKQVYSSVEVVGNLGKRSDEIGEIVNGFNNFTEKLQSIISQVKKSRDTLGSAGTTLDSSTLNTTSSIENILTSIESVHTQINNQSNSVQQTAGAVNEIASNIESLGHMIEKQSSEVSDASAAIEQMMTEKTLQERMDRARFKRLEELKYEKVSQQIKTCIRKMLQ